MQLLIFFLWITVLASNSDAPFFKHLSLNVFWFDCLVSTTESLCLQLFFFCRACHYTSGVTRLFWVVKASPSDDLFIFVACTFSFSRNEVYLTLPTFKCYQVQFPFCSEKYKFGWLLTNLCPFRCKC